MKIYRQLIFIIIILISFASMLEAKPPSGKKLIKSIQKAYDDLETFSCDFHQEVQLTLIGESEVIDGQMWMTNDDKFRYDSPVQVMVTDGKTLWRYSVKTNQMIVENLKDAESGVLPREILFDYPKQFDITKVVDAVVDRRPAYLMDLIPKEGYMGVGEVKVWVDAEDSIARRIEWSDNSDGQTSVKTTYILKNIKINPEIPQDKFTFENPEGVTVYDLR